MKEIRNNAFRKNKYNPFLKLAYDISNEFSVSIEELFIFDNLN